jgi:putative spermidine/putrescine transport system ATP-binding protein
VARFIGGHNVVSLPEGHFAVRSDAVGMTAPEDGKIEAFITGIEYQGTHVAVTARIAGDQEITAVISDAAFFEHPKNPGDRVGLIGEQENLHKLIA